MVDPAMVAIAVAFLQCVLSADKFPVPLPDVVPALLDLGCSAQVIHLDKPLGGTLAPQFLVQLQVRLMYKWYGTSVEPVNSKGSS